MRRHPRWFLAVALLAVGMAGCGSSPGGAAVIKLQGTGATFPRPIYDKWFKAYNAAHPNVQVNYQPQGSGAGVKAVIDHTVDFGASDAAMTEEEMAKVPEGVCLLPMTAGSIVLAYNLPEVDELKLSREAYVGIFLGTITKWSDPLIASSNPGTKLPDSEIHVIVRADSSGTTYVFTKHLSEISAAFKANPGVDKMPNWPTGTKSKGNDGVTASLAHAPGAIAYMEYSYAMQTRLKTARLENKAGKFVAATIASGQAALESIDMPDNLVAWLPDPAGDDSYPIVTYTWIMAYHKYADAKKAQTLKDVLQWCLTDGQKQSAALGYIPLPTAVADKVLAALDQIQGGAK